MPMLARPKKTPFNLQDQVLSVAEFNQLIDEIISPLQVVVEGELVRIESRSGRWLFATLKDNKASVSVFSPLSRIPNWQVLQEGMRVRVDGWPRLYQKTGKFSLFARSIAPAGKGALKEALEKLRKELESLGYFALDRKRSLPTFITKIGLITAPGSRAYSDFIKVINDQPSGIEIDFYPVSVQGDLAVGEIKSAFDFFNHQASHYDLLVLTRGGGSLEDLLPFNSRIIAEAVYGAKVPVLAAIGHEADKCLIDLVADVRAPTPTGAAQIINHHHQEVLASVDDLAKTLTDSYQRLILAQKEIATGLAGRLSFYYQRQFRQADYLFTNFERMIDYFSDQIFLKKETLGGLEKLLESLDCKNVLRRGFTLTLDNHDKIITDLEKVSLADQIVTRFYQGEIVSQVKSKNDH